MLSLHKYLKEHSALAKLRMFFIVLFAIFLSISIGLGQTYYVLGWFSARVLAITRGAGKTKSSWHIVNIIMYVLPPVVALHVYCTAVLQLWPDKQKHIKDSIRKFYRKFGVRVMPERLLQKVLGQKLSAKCRHASKQVLWFIIFLNPPVIFAFQIIFAMISFAFILIQKFAEPPKFFKDCKGSPKELCDSLLCQGLNNNNENQWGFGQMLAMALLVLPFLAAIETYQG